MDKVILTDADGTIVWWLNGFTKYMEDNGVPIVPDMEEEYSISKKYNIPVSVAQNYIREFNEGPWIANLPAFADSVEYISKFVNLGFRFILITSQSTASSAKLHRTANVSKLFGNIFDEIHCIEMGADKQETLSRWKDTGYFWIEDHLGQAMAGYNVGLRPILIDHPYNRLHYSTSFTKVSYETPWKEIYNIITKDYNLL